MPNLLGKINAVSRIVMNRFQLQILLRYIFNRDLGPF